MPQCPQCGTALKDDYGMITCPTCGTILFIDMDGVAHRGTEAEPASATEPERAPQSPAQAFPDPFVFSPVEANPPSSFEPQSPFAEPISEGFAFPQDHIFENQPGSTGECDSQEPVMPEAMPVGEPDYSAPADFSMDNLLGYGDPSAAEPVVGSVPSGTPSSELGPPDDPLGIASYANSEISLGKDGPFVFHIHLAGIDTKEIREALKESMQDSRFAWNVAQFMAKISKGNLTLENVPPVKAAILINRIKRLPLEIRWEQVPITQLDAQ